MCHWINRVFRGHALALREARIEGYDLAVEQLKTQAWVQTGWLHLEGDTPDDLISDMLRKVGRRAR